MTGISDLVAAQLSAAAYTPLSGYKNGNIPLGSYVPDGGTSLP
jgi:hypothetical protein